MLTVFNRRELLITDSLDEQAHIRDQFAAAGIKYRLATRSAFDRSLWTSSRSRYGTVGMNMDCAYEYVFYVHRKDYDFMHSRIGI